MIDAENSIKIAEQNQSAGEFIANIAPMTTKSGQADLLRELGRITDRDAILEIWCGGGDLAAQLAQIGARVVGADYSQKLIDAARIRFPQIEFVMSDQVLVDFPSETFDVVVSNSSAHHYSAPERNFAEARRVLKPGGRLLVSIPIQSKRVGFNIVVQAAREFLDLPEKVIKGGPLHDAENVQEIVDVMRVAGFDRFEGAERTSYTVMESIDTLLGYAWKKIDLAGAAQGVQDRIRDKSLERAQAYRHGDGSYRFPERFLVVRGDK